MKTSVRTHARTRVEGVAVMTSAWKSRLIDDLKLRQVPLVFGDVGPPRPRVSNIRSNISMVSGRRCSHIVALRHERIAFISGQLTMKSPCTQRGVYPLQTEIGMHVITMIIEGNLN